MVRKQVGILISGRGSNMAALIEAARAENCAYEIACVISNRPDAAGLRTARQAGIATIALDHKTLGTREALDAAMHDALLVNGVDLVVCAGFMRIMTGGFIAKWEGRIINIHPSLLPLFKGVDTHEQALQAGVRVHGCSVHFVSAELMPARLLRKASSRSCRVTMQLRWQHGCCPWNTGCTHRC